MASPPTSEDQDLVRRVRRADALAWEAFVRLHQSRVFGLAYHLLGSAEDARDVSQEVFVRIFQHLARVPDAEAVVPWLLRVTRNGCIDAQRRRRARPPAWDLPVEDVMVEAPSELGPEAAHQAKARKLELYRALRELTALNRELILLKEIHGLTFEEIAQTLGVPVGTVKSRSNRARLELADKLAASGWGG
jgi:RNA polymerase sigma-70 factor (ECF subfamily)